MFLFDVLHAGYADVESKSGRPGSIIKFCAKHMAKPREQYPAMTTRIQIASMPVQSGTLALPSTARKAIGIDLGTTNSVVSLGTWDPSEPEVFHIRCLEVEQPTSESGDHTGTLVPSIVSLTSDKTYVGEGAKRLIASGASRGLRRDREFFFETKNEMGTDRRRAVQRF